MSPHFISQVYATEDPDRIEAAEARLAAEPCGDIADAVFKLASAASAVEDLASFAPGRLDPAARRAVQSLVSVMDFLAQRPADKRAVLEARGLYGI